MERGVRRGHRPFATASRRRAAARARIDRVARAAGMAVARPDGKGVLSPATNASPYFGVVEGPARLRGDVGVVARSGAIAVGLLTDCRRSGISQVVSSGMEAVIGPADFLSYLVRGEATRVIALFVEAVRGVPAFTAAPEAAAEPVVVRKVGSGARRPP